MTNDFESFKELAKKHSEGLDYVFNELSEQAKTRPGNSDIKFEKNQIFNLTKEYFLSNPTIRELAGMSGTDFSIIAIKTRSNQEDLESSIKLSDAAQGIFDGVMEYFPLSTSYVDFENFVKSRIECETFKSIDSDEQKLLTFMLCVVLDSSLYWTDIDNFNKWTALASGQTIEKTNTRGNVGPPAYYWIPEDRMVEVGKIVTADAVGCLGTFVGALTFNPLGWLVCGTVSSAWSMLDESEYFEPPIDEDPGDEDNTAVDDGGR